MNQTENIMSLVDALVELEHDWAEATAREDAYVKNELKDRVQQQREAIKAKINRLEVATKTLFDAVAVYGLDHMHGMPKRFYEKTAREALVIE